MHFVVYRGSWHRGGNVCMQGASSLLDERNRMCCLGHVMCELAMPLPMLLKVGFPASVYNRNKQSLVLLVQRGLVQHGLVQVNDLGYGMNTEFAVEAASVNDNPDMPDDLREERLKEAFRVAGHELVFEDGIAPWFEAA